MTLPNDQYLTGEPIVRMLREHRLTWSIGAGSADKSLRLWQGAKCERSYEGHKDVVRGIALITDIGFASCANSG